MGESLQIDQALYGYQDGHRLLASSTEIPAEAARLILPLSDGPDLQVRMPDEGYLSGYPVPALEAFALSRTWPAPEMRRPGCVWTHVLLIDTEELAAIGQPAQLQDCFVRPRGPEPDYSSYSRGLAISPKPPRSASAERRSDLAQAMLYWIYETTEPVVLRGEERSSCERQALDLWGQQWPSLRRSFSFISIPTTRVVGSRPFDLRLVFDADPVLSRAMGGDVHSATDAWPSAAPWLAMASGDLSSPGPMREVLWRYGPEAGSERRAFAPIATLFVCVKSEPHSASEFADCLLDSVVTAFPEAAQMRGLKRDLFGPDHLSSSLAPRSGQLRWEGSEAELLFALVGAADQSALSVDDLEVGPRAEKLWNENRSQALQLLQRCAEHPERPLARVALEALLPRATSVPELVTKEAPSAVPLVIDHDPSFATNSLVWRAPEPEIERRWSALGSIPGVGKVRKEVVRAMITSGAPSAVRRAFSRWGSAIVADLLEIAGEHSAPRLDEGWVSVLLENPGAVAEWFANSKAIPARTQAELIAETADASEIARIGRPLKPWLGLIEAKRHGVFALTPRQQAFLFRLGLSSKDPSASMLLRETFMPLRRALQEGPPSSDPLFEGPDLKTKLKSGGKRIYIDPLTLALVERWREQHWPVSALVESATEPEVVTKIVAAYAQSKKGSKEIERYLESLTDKHDADLIRAVPSTLRPPPRKASR